MLNTKIKLMTKLFSIFFEKSENRHGKLSPTTLS